MSLRLDRVSLRLGDQQVLDQVSLHVREGDCYGFLGHNGAGKTTALRIALGLVRADSGRVLVDGFDAAEHPLEARARIGGLVEVPGFHGHLSGGANLRLLARLQGIPSGDADAAVQRVLDLAGIAHAGRKPVAAYSQGMRQRLGIAQALLGRPRIVLLDEPLNGLDPEGIEEMRRLLRRLTTEEGTTVLLSSHQLGEVAAVCNRVGILRKGRFVLETETAALAAGSGRTEIRAADPAGAERVLRARGIGVERLPSGGLVAELDERAGAETLAALVGAGVGVSAFAPRARSLEDVYLSAAAGGPEGVPGGSSATSGDLVVAASVGPPASRVAPGNPTGRVLRYELRRWVSSSAVPLALVLPAIAGTLRVLRAASEEAANRKALADGALATYTEVNGFQSVALALGWGLPVLATVLAALAAQSFSGEASRGTLRNVLLRPVGRGHVVAGKTLAVLSAGAVGAVLLGAATAASCSAWFTFGDLAEVLPNGKRMVLQSAAEVWPEVRRAALAPLPALAAYGALGLLVGVLARTAAGAMAGAFLLVAGLLTATVVWPTAFPTSHLPWVLRDDSAVHRLLGVAQNESNPLPPDAAGPWWSPFLWTVLSLVLVHVVVRRRSWS